MSNWYSAHDLAKLGKQLIGGLPTSAPGCTGRAKSENWESREVKGKGGKGGKRTEYKPPQAVLNAIKAYTPAESRPAQGVQEEALQYDSLKVFADNVVKLNAKPKRWLEEIVNHFVSLPEQEQEKIRTYSQDLYAKVSNQGKPRSLNVTISGLVETPLSNGEVGTNEREPGGN